MPRNFSELKSGGGGQFPFPPIDARGYMARNKWLYIIIILLE